MNFYIFLYFIFSTKFSAKFQKQIYPLEIEKNEMKNYIEISIFGIDHYNSIDFHFKFYLLIFLEEKNEFKMKKKIQIHFAKQNTQMDFFFLQEIQEF